jgi:glycosyltransferase involved in cell wall biosynthesis
LLVVGDGPTAADLQRQAVELGIASAVRFTGAVEHGRVPDCIAAMDVTAAPYLPATDFYFSPIKIYEYLAAGKPVVASELGQIAALVQTIGCGPPPPAMPQRSPAALESVLAAPHAAAAQAARGRDWVLHERTWEANARRALMIAMAGRGAGV